MKNDLKSGFTLAEILITLVVLGIVFAYSVGPMLLALTKTDVPVKLKKVQSVFSQMTNSLISENGTFITWDWFGNKDADAAKNMMESMFKPKLSIAMYCGLDTGKGCWEPYTMLDGTNGENPDNFNYATKAILNDGTSISFETTKACRANTTPAEICGKLIVDINGPKKPNKVGRDVFFFAFYSDSNFLPLGYYMKKDDVESNCSKDNKGDYCAAKIALDGWEILEQGPHVYPW